MLGLYPCFLTLIVETLEAFMPKRLDHVKECSMLRTAQQPEGSMFTYLTSSPENPVGATLICADHEPGGDFSLSGKSVRHLFPTGAGGNLFDFFAGKSA
jgi:hypothetical protein